MGSPILAKSPYALYGSDILGKELPHANSLLICKSYCNFACINGAENADDERYNYCGRGEAACY